jgi:hypothetical protein
MEVGSQGRRYLVEVGVLEESLILHCICVHGYRSKYTRNTLVPYPGLYEPSAQDRKGSRYVKEYRKNGNVRAASI